MAVSLWKMRLDPCSMNMLPGGMAAKGREVSKSDGGRTKPNQRRLLRGEKHLQEYTTFINEI